MEMERIHFHLYTHTTYTDTYKNHNIFALHGKSVIIQVWDGANLVIEHT